MLVIEMNIENKQVDLWDLSNEAIYVKFGQGSIEKFLDYAVSLAGSKANLAKMVRRKSLQSNFRVYRNCKSFISLKIVKEILSLFPESTNKEFKNDLKNNLEEIKCEKSRKTIKSPKFPLKLSQDFFGLLGNLIADCYVETKYGSVQISYLNKCEALLDQFKERVNNVFGKVEAYERTNKNDVKEIRYPAIVGVLIGEMIGKLPKGLENISVFVLNSDEKSQMSFLQALFDDEGCVSVEKYQIIIEMANENIIKCAKEMLLKFGIRAGKISIVEDGDYQTRYRFGISNKRDLELFNEKICFKHPHKKNKIRILLNSYKQPHYGKGGESRESIIKLLNESTLTRREMSDRLKRPIGSLERHLQKLEKESVIKSIRDEKRIKTYYINSIRKV